MSIIIYGLPTVPTRSTGNGNGWACRSICSIVDRDHLVRSTRLLNLTSKPEPHHSPSFSADIITVKVKDAAEVHTSLRSRTACQWSLASSALASHLAIASVAICRTDVWSLMFSEARSEKEMGMGDGDGLSNTGARAGAASREPFRPHGHA